MEERVLDIQLMDRPRMGQCQSQNCTNSRGLHHWAEGLIIVNSRPLSETPENPPGIMLLVIGNVLIDSETPAVMPTNL